MSAGFPRRLSPSSLTQSTIALGYLEDVLDSFLIFPFGLESDEDVHAVGRQWLRSGASSGRGDKAHPNTIPSEEEVGERNE